MDKMSGTRKPFAFVGFDSAQAVEQLCTVDKHSVGNKMVCRHYHVIGTQLSDVVVACRLKSTLLNTASVVRLNAT